ncbi:23S rRNA (adenine(2030)-N(6))-methyltransferase RlmJ [Marinobacter nanhaiticus D15-8W]|uniref:Ribosomal RNA large subunit methyltransferase J n=1 Tax=Marinobacter nanhaiticus D15-8W TaxID=626887 RepID=N6WWI0_9GAMM|nr:23S rRNA (adenine(2030)-N(6))-methyltransferase RlmJ [Marinobacter nanhaiticus]ENO13163.1 23S rRNA (adenine(2030)-N(6))-methyltransferase RlmJ [Marinobacter nanhaiticus D15-8W]BES70523.1 23S rRNA (adenine(2030)-N(6))-methyltransferase RlmJ [Marinobacter nanhaiticus D15-8W]
MLSYLHAFHAGNFADVHKHLGLFVALKLMQRKPTPIACFDTHGGSALYDLAGDKARKTGEAYAGVQRVWQRRATLEHELWPEVWGLIGGDPNEAALRYYPGSPAWLEGLRREQDSVTAFELHSNESSRLQQWAASTSVGVIAADGFRGLLSALPPREPRLFTLIDPPYEIKDDYARTADTLIRAWKRCRHGVYLVWYPVLPEAQFERMIEQVQGSPMTKVLRSQYLLDQPPERGMAGSGLLLVNPPWGWADAIQSMLGEIHASGAIAARHQLDWVVPE